MILDVSTFKSRVSNDSTRGFPRSSESLDNQPPSNSTEDKSEGQARLSNLDSSHQSLALSQPPIYERCPEPPLTDTARGLARTVSEVRDEVPNQRDAEFGADDLESEELPNPEDPNLVQWDGMDDPQNPKCWPNRRKWAAVIIGMLESCVFGRMTSLNK